MFVLGGQLRTLPVSETHVGSSEGLGSIAGLVRSSDSDVAGCRCRDAPPLETAGGAKMTFFGRYAASRRASFEPASSHVENVSSRACRTYWDCANGLSRGVRGGTKSAVPASPGRLSTGADERSHSGSVERERGAARANVCS